MKILVTGAYGFVGKNLVWELKNRNYEVYEYDISVERENLDKFCRDCDFVVNLAGVNRPDNSEEFMKGNRDFLCELLDCLKKNNNKCPVLLSSSIQAESDNPYGNSKKAAEDELIKYSEETGVKIFIYRFPNLFGKWCRPGYNSVIATFCYNIARSEPITINSKDVELNLVYIDDAVSEIISSFFKEKGGYCTVEPIYSVSLGELADLIKSFCESRSTLLIPDMNNEFVKKLYSTYLSYLPEDKFGYELLMHEDDRGSFTEFIKSVSCGQVSINVAKPGIVKGNHWHHTKNEKFLVVSGEGLISFKNIFTDEIIEYRVSGKKLKVIDIPVGYTHSIENVGEEDLVTVMWVNETFNPDTPDTFFLPVR